VRAFVATLGFTCGFSSSSLVAAGEGRRAGIVACARSVQTSTSTSSVLVVVVVAAAGDKNEAIAAGATAGASAEALSYRA